MATKTKITKPKPEIKKEKPVAVVSEVSAKGKHLRITPKKVNRILKEIRTKQVNEAITILKFLPHSGARYVEKVLNSAIANAEHNYKMNRESLYIAKALVDSGVIMKRWRAGGRGRAARIQKLTSHITIVLHNKEKK